MAKLKRFIGELDALIEEILLASRIDAAAANEAPSEEVDLTGLAAESARAWASNSKPSMS